MLARARSDNVTVTIPLTVLLRFGVALEQSLLKDQCAPMDILAMGRGECVHPDTPFLDICTHLYHNYISPVIDPKPAVETLLEDEDRKNKNLDKTDALLGKLRQAATAWKPETSNPHPDSVLVATAMERHKRNIESMERVRKWRDSMGDTKVAKRRASELLMLIGFAEGKIAQDSLLEALAERHRKVQYSRATLHWHRRTIEKFCAWQTTKETDEIP